MISLIKWVLITICNVLPESPFTNLIDNLYFNPTYLKYLNWFLPIDLVGTMFTAWVSCILVYIVFRIIWKIIVNIILKKLVGGVASLAKLLV